MHTIKALSRNVFPRCRNTTLTTRYLRHFHDTKLVRMASNQSGIALKNDVSEQTPAAFDFRSDTVTTPTPSMLQSILSIATHGDDVFHEDSTTNALESFITTLTGKPAAVFVLSGTMGNQLSIRSHLAQPPHSILLDQRCHIYNYEAGGAAVLSQAQITPVTPANGMYLTLDEVRAAVVDSDDIHYAPTRLICLENSLNGVIMPLEEIRRITAYARRKGIKMHLDGARLWNVVAAGGGDLKEIIAEFDSVSLCFSKGLGAPMGSVVVGEEAFVQRVRHFRKMVGGGTRQCGIATAPARTAIEEVFLGGRLARTHELARRVAAVWDSLGGKLKVPCDTNMVWLDLESLGVDADDIPMEAQRAGLKWDWERIVVHHQICDEAIGKLEDVLRKLAEKARARGGMLPEGKKARARYTQPDDE